MGILVQGSWRDEELPTETDSVGAFQRSESQFRNRITADGTSGFKAEPGRHHLYVAYNCPWAHRVLIFRAVKKLEAAITVAYALPGIREQGWLFASHRQFSECTPDTVNGFRHLHQAYTASDLNYTGKVTVPTLWDTRTRQIVNNESSEIIRMLNSEFRVSRTTLRTLIQHTCALKSTGSTSSCMPMSTTVSTGAVSRALRLLTKRPMTPSSRRLTS